MKGPCPLCWKVLNVFPIWFIFFYRSRISLLFLNVLPSEKRKQVLGYRMFVSICLLGDTWVAPTEKKGSWISLTVMVSKNMAKSMTAVYHTVLHSIWLHSAPSQKVEISQRTNAEQHMLVLMNQSNMRNSTIYSAVNTWLKFASSWIFQSLRQLETPKYTWILIWVTKEIRILLPAFLHKENFFDPKKIAVFSKSTQLSITTFRWTKDPLDLEIHKSNIPETPKKNPCNY